MLGHPLQYKQVEPNRWRYLRGFNNHNQEDAKPNHVNSCGTYHGLDNGHRQNHRREAIHEHSQDKVKYRQHRNQCDRRKVISFDQFSHSARQSSEAHRQRQECSPHQDQGNHRGCTGRSHKALGKAGPIQ